MYLFEVSVRVYYVLFLNKMIEFVGVGLCYVWFVISGFCELLVVVWIVGGKIV